jgi:biopolymer transport protein ExbD
MEYKFKTKFQYRSIMDMVPLIDFSFSILIFFMMTYNAEPGKLSSIMVNLPKAVKVTSMQNSNMVVSVNEKNEVFIDDIKYSIDKLPDEFKRRKGNLKEGIVIIRGDKKANYDTIVKIMDNLSQAGIIKFTLATVRY